MNRNNWSIVFNFEGEYSIITKNGNFVANKNLDKLLAEHLKDIKVWKTKKDATSIAIEKAGKYYWQLIPIYTMKEKVDKT